MASQDRGSPPNLKTDVLAGTWGFSFLQAVRLLHAWAGGAAQSPRDEFLTNRLRVRPELSLGFPARDLVSAEAQGRAERERYRLTATFLGLYGVSSPLPTHYTEELVQEALDDRSVSRDFLDILNEPFFRLFFQCWSKYRWFLKVVEEEDAPSLERLYCLLGLGHEEARAVAPDPYGLLRYLGLFTQFPRSALGLRTLLADALKVPSVVITPCLLRRVDISPDQQCRLGQRGTTLGEDCFLGQEIDDRMGKIRITLADLDGRQFHEFLPGTAKHKKIGDLVRLYLQEPLEYEVELALRPEAVRTVPLGAPVWSCLGRDSWVFSGRTLPVEARVRFQAAAAPVQPATRKEHAA